MKITLCGSISFYDEMLKVKKELEKMGHEVKLPPTEIKNKEGKMIPVSEYYLLRKKETSENSWIWDRKAELIKIHYKKEEWCDVLLVTNYDKNGIKGYIGGNTLIEMGVAFYLDKPIYLLNQIPEISYKEEILGMRVIAINGDLKAIK